MNWQPISTVPADAKDIIGWCERHGTMQAIQLWRDAEGYWVDYYDHYRGNQPLLWVPFFSPPSET